MTANLGTQHVKKGAEVKTRGVENVLNESTEKIPPNQEEAFRTPTRNGKRRTYPKCRIVKVAIYNKTIFKAVREKNANSQSELIRTTPRQQKPKKPENTVSP